MVIILCVSVKVEEDIEARFDNVFDSLESCLNWGGKLGCVC